jgi:hypothetical protein
VGSQVADHRRVIAAALACLAACGAAPPPITDEPVPSTVRDPAPWTPAAAIETTTGEPAALTPSGGVEQTRELVRSLVLAIRDGDGAAITASLADRITHAQPGIGHTTWTRETIVEQMLAGAAAAHVEADTPFEELIDPATIRVTDASTYYRGTFPAGVADTDQVVQFAPTALGRRLLAGLGTGTVVVRPGPSAVIVAR